MKGLSMNTSRNIRFTDTALSFIVKYQEQYGCSFNKAVNDLIEKAGNEAGQSRQRTHTMQKQVEQILQILQGQRKQ